MVEKQNPVVIVGAGHAGVQLASNLRLDGWSDGIVLIDKDPNFPYDRPPLSKEYLNGDRDGDYLLRSEGFYEKNDIDLRLGMEVNSIDSQKHTIILSNNESIQYSKLILATGARARRLEVPGSTLKGINYLRTKADAEQLYPLLSTAQNVVVIGAGYIGMEVAAAAAAKGSNVTVIEFMDRVMSRVTSTKVSAFFTGLHEQFGTKFIFNEAVTGFTGNSHVTEVLTKSGDSYPADLVVIGVGILPNEEIAEKAAVNFEGGVPVDIFCQTNTADIYAMGDLAKFKSKYADNQIRLECIQNAVNHAAVISKHITAKAPPEHEEVPWFWTVQHGVRLQTAGLWSPTDEIIVRELPKENSFSVLYIRAGQLAAIDTINALGEFAQGKKIIHQGNKLDIEMVRDSTKKLSAALLAGN